jgi:predicted N-acyltransferase
MSEKTFQIYDSINDLNENQWNDVVKQSERGSVFHRAGWLRAVEEGLGRSARHLVLEKGNNPIALLPNFVREVDLPSSLPSVVDRFDAKRLTSIEPGFGGPLFMGSERSNFEMMFDHIDRLLERDDIVNHRVKAANDEYLRYSRPFSEYGYQLSSDICRLIIDLDQGWDSIESNMNKSKRSNISKARENDATVHERSLEGEALDTFYETYQEAMDRVGGTAYPYAFLERIGEEMADRTELFTVEVDGEFAAGQVYLVDDEQSSVHCFFQAVDEDYFDYYPSELLDEHGMKWAIEREYSEYDLGSSPSDFTDGSFRYKNELGARPRPVLSWERGCSPIKWPMYRLGRWYFKNRNGSSELSSA